MSRESSPPLPDRLISIAFFGLAFGYAEVGVLLVRRHLLGDFVFNVGPFVWMTPVGYLLFFLPVGLILGEVGRVRGRPLDPNHGVTIALGCFGLLSLTRGIHPLALALVAAGLGVTTSRLLDARSAQWRRTRNRTTLVLTTVWLVAFGAQWPASARPGDSANAGPAAEHLNLLLIVWDTVRAANLSLYGYERSTTSGLERMADESIVFDRAFATAPWTLPSHATLFTGLYPQQLNASWLTPLEPDPQTLAEALRARGYRTIAFTANSGYTDTEKGLSRGFDRYVDHRATLRQYALSSALVNEATRWLDVLTSADGVLDVVRRLGEVSRFRYWDARGAADISNEFLGWLRAEPRRPFFAFLNLMDAHVPHWAPGETLERYRHAESGNPFRDTYDAAIDYLDASLDALLRELGRTGELERTVVVLTSDHGELLGEHGLFLHGQSLYLPLLHVPLVIRHPAGIGAGSRIGEPVSLRDLPATLLDLLSLAPGALPGESLVPLARGEATRVEPSAVIGAVDEGVNVPETEPVARGDMETILTDRLHLIVNGDGALELYDYVRDPGETRNLAREAAFRSTLAELMVRLERLASG